MWQTGEGKAKTAVDGGIKWAYTWCIQPWAQGKTPAITLGAAHSLLGGNIMNILVLNASPKGQNSTTVHTALYIQALHPEHDFTFLPV